MKKLMEVYGIENGIIIKKFQKVYHLFCGIENKEEVESYKIASRADVANFLLKFFENELNVEFKEKDRIEPDKCGVKREIHYHFDFNK